MRLGGHKQGLAGEDLFSPSMKRFRHRRFNGARAAVILLLASSFVFMPAQAFAWGKDADRLVVSSAIGTLPGKLRPFFEANRQYLVRHVWDPTEASAKTSSEKQDQYIRLDHYGLYPFSSLPRDYKSALRKLGRRTLDANGLLPWQVGVYSAKLTDDFRSGNWEQAKMDAALLANYVTDAHDPFKTTINDDGQLSGQLGIEDRFGNKLVSRFSQFFYLHPNPAAFISDPTDHAFEMCLDSHAWLENILIADRRARQGLPDYNDEYFDRFYSQAGAILVRQISDAATDVGSYWLTAWENAGRPALPAQ
jgi:hypothetical protein